MVSIPVDFAIGLERQPRKREVDAAGQALQAPPGERAVGGVAKQVPMAAGLLVAEHVALVHERQLPIAMAGNEYGGGRQPFAARDAFAIERRAHAFVAREHHHRGVARSEEHTSALQSLMRITYAV